MELNLQHKKALVLGASQGIDMAIANSLIDEGADVSIASRSEDKLAATAKEIGAQDYFVCDLTQKGAGTKLFGEYLSRQGHIDILVVNTGGPQKDNFLEVTIEQWETDFQSLWISAVKILRQAIPAMQKDGYGRVIFITSIAAREALDGLTTSNGIRP